MREDEASLRSRRKEWVDSVQARDPEWVKELMVGRILPTGYNSAGRLLRMDAVDYLTPTARPLASLSPDQGGIGPGEFTSDLPDIERVTRVLVQTGRQGIWSPAAEMLTDHLNDSRRVHYPDEIETQWMGKTA